MSLHKIIDTTNHEQRYAMGKILEIFLIYESDDENESFENYIENNLDYLNGIFKLKTQYSYVEAANKNKDYLKLEKYREDLRYGLS